MVSTFAVVFGLLRLFVTSTTCRVAAFDSDHRALVRYRSSDPLLDIISYHEHHEDSRSRKRADLTRRGLLSSCLGLSLPLMNPTSIGSSAATDFPSSSTSRTTAAASAESLTVPLQYIPSLSAYVLYYQVGGERFGAIIDSGSPFLMVPGYCNERTWGCYKPDASRPSGLLPTYEKFDNNEGEVEWRIAPFAFVNATGSMMGPKEMIFGVLSESLLSGPGGVFFGLIRDTDEWIRPSFLGQTNVNSFDIDLRDHKEDNLKKETKTLTLYTTPNPSLRNAEDGTSTTDYIPLVRDLTRKYGDPVLHYTAKAVSLFANGRPVVSPHDNLPLYVIFDTGVTGMVVSRELMEQRYADARQNREKSLWGTVEISFQTKQGDTVSLSAKKPVTTPLGAKPWPKFKKAHLVVIGLAFLDGRKTSIDIDNQQLRIQD